MKFQDLLSRCDVEVFQRFLGGSCIRLLGLLDSTMSSPTFLRRLVLDSIGPHGLLSDGSMRSELLMLLHPNEAARLCVALGLGDGLDHFAKLRGCSVSRASSREQALFDFFELPLPVQELIEPDPTVSPTVCSYPLFEHQRTSSRKVLRQIRTAPHRVLLHMPTGSGKTRTAMNVICNHLREREPTVVVWLAYSEELCDQAAEEFTKAWNALGDRTISLRRFWGPHELDMKDFNDGILVAGLHKLLRYAEKDFPRIGTLGTLCSLVTLDEAHQAVAPQYKHVIDALLSLNTDSGFLGLSATPGRTWNDVGADEELAIFFSRRKVGLDIAGYPNPVDYLVEEGYLAQTTFTPMFYKPGASFEKSDLLLLAKSLDVPDSILERLGSDEQRNLAIITKVEKLVERHTRIIVFAASVTHAHLIAAVLRARSLNAVAVTTRTPPHERARSIEAFKTKTASPMILCNYGVLTTGFDAPQTSCAVIARPTKSLVLYSQMVGRAIRGTKAGGNASAEIVTVVDQQLPGFGNVADAFANWEDIWTIPVT